MTVIVLTENQKKFAEYEIILGRYGITIEHRPPVDSKDVLGLFDDPTVKYVLRESSNLYNAHSNDFSTKNEHLEVVYNLAELTVYHKSKLGKLIISRFSHRIDGYINLDKHIEGAFDWDDIFVVLSTQMTYHEMKQRGVKNSARDLVLSDFLAKFYHYKERIDLKFNPQKVEETVEFSDAPLKFIQSNTFINNAHMPQYHLDKAVRGVLHNGLFFRSPSNRREKNYWSPGLNGGLPLTPKKDDIHETTFMFHDLMHFMMPDLVYTGQTDALHRNVYILYRMMSEAITLVMADMLFIDTLVKSGIEYDYSKRRIYPLFASLDLDFSPDHFQQTLKKLLFANVRYALLGDDSHYKMMQKVGDQTDVLEAFKEKYHVFFIEDYRWTGKNFDCMAKTNLPFIDWVDFMGRESFQSAGLVLLDDFTESLIQNHDVDVNQIESLVPAIFEDVFHKIIWPSLNFYGVIDKDTCISNGFKRYFLSQMLVFSRYRFVSGSNEMAERLLEIYKEKDFYSAEDIHTIRCFYNLYIDHLFAQRVISQDDHIVYKQIFPMFEPFYVFYDTKKEITYRTIMESAVGTLRLGETK